jgi:hypothetical protein
MKESFRVIVKITPAQKRNSEFVARFNREKMAVEDSTEEIVVPTLC